MLFGFQFSRLHLYLIIAVDYNGIILAMRIDNGPRYIYPSIALIFLVRFFINLIVV